MSANLDLVRSLFPAWERGDWSSVEWAHPEIEFESADGLPTWSATGIRELGRTWREFLDTWEEWRVQAEEFHELTEDRVLVLIRIGGRGRSSGLEVDRISARGANLFEFRDGKVIRLVLYWDRARALADAGLTGAGEAG